MDYFPPESEYDTYVEPFIGGGAIYWKKEPTETEVINDLDSDLVGAYRLLRDIKSRDFRTDLNSVEKIQRFVDGVHRTDADKLTFQIVNRCNNFPGSETGKIYKPINPYAKLKKIDAYQERMEGTKIENMSYEKVIEKYDSPKTFFYLDPPYEEKKSTGVLYKHGGMTFDYEKFRDVLAKTKGKWLLSINDSPNIRRIFKGFYYKAFTVKAKGNRGIGSKDRKELLISNYGD
jgi:DNA adenine methylase